MFIYHYLFTLVLKSPDGEWPITYTFTFTFTEQSAKHHEDTRILQSLFYRDVVSLARKIEEMSNPFMEETDDLLTLDTKQIMSHSDALARVRKV